MKVYGIPDLDGLIEAKVAAGSLADAATALGMSIRRLRELDWRQVKGAAATAARKQTGQPLYRALGTQGGWTSNPGDARAAAARRMKRAALA